MFKIANADVGFVLTDPGVAVDAATLAAYTDFSTRVTRGLLVATANFDTERVEATFRATASETTTPVATGWELQLRVKQDPEDDQTSGLAKFLYENDAGESGAAAYFYLGLASGRAPKAIGQCYLAPQDFGGAARTTLYADLRFSVPVRPEIEYGTTADA